MFLYYCTKAGLDLAIVNAEKLERFASLDSVERQLAENLLFNRSVKGKPGTPGFPFESCGFGQLHAVLSRENHVRSRQ